MYRLVFAALTLSAIAIILVLTASPSPTAEARFIRWDCSDWQPYPAVADAEDELASSILETLAANRGKTLYCGLDQSDTWTKRQVYDHAHMHNDRDRTQYDGSQGQGRFRGFTAGQEGWLTDGEHGITGVSPERIFEFPEQERGRRKIRILRKQVSSGPADGNYCPDRSRSVASGNAQADYIDTNTLGDLICTPYADTAASSWANNGADYRDSRNGYTGNTHGSNGYGFHWRTGAKTGTGGGAIRGNVLTEAGWIAKAEAAAIPACKALGGGYKYQRGSADFGMGHNHNRGENNLRDMGPGHGWFFAARTLVSSGQTYFFRRARESRTWSATCYKRVRGSRRR